MVAPLQKADQQQSTARRFAMTDLDLFNLLEHPIWVFNITQRSMSWGNQAAVELWDANSLEELQARSFKDMSESTITRLNDYQVNFFAKSEKVRDQWTFYPNGEAKTVQVTCGGIQMHSSDHLMLVEGVYVLAKEQIQKNLNVLRGVEMLRHLPISVTQFDLKGNVMYQNPESLDTFGSPREQSVISDEDETEQDNTEQQEEEDPIEGDSEGEAYEKKEEDNNSNKESSATKHTRRRRANKPQHVPDFLARFVDQKLGEQVLRDVQAGETVSVEANQVTRKNGVRWSALKLRQAKDPVTSEPVILYCARDISDSVAAKKAKEALDKKSEFLAIMAHEIRTPLHQVTGFIDLLAQMELDMEQRSFVKLLQSSANGLMVVISGVLDYSKLEAGKMKLECIPFEPKSVIQCSMDAVKQSYDDKNLSLKLSWDKNIPFKIMGDSNRLRQVLLNFLSNSLKFTNQGDIHIKVSHQNLEQPLLSSNQDKRHHGVLQFQVNDTGIGISYEHKCRIFQEYQQADASIARNFGGTGLGLSICKSLIQNMGGTIGIESELGKGSTFWFALPYETPPEEEEDEEREETSVGQKCPAANANEGLHVLVAEDNLVNQKLMVSMLKRMGHTAKVVENGKEAVEEVDKKESAFDLVLMDQQMPVMDGIEATRRLRSMGYSDLPIYALTASVQRADFLELGFNDWLSKPVPMKKLKEKLQRLQQSLTLIQEDHSILQRGASNCVATRSRGPERAQSARRTSIVMRQ